MRLRLHLLILFTIICLTDQGPLFAKTAPKDRIRVVGSSVVYRYAATVAEHFSKLNPYPTPIIEATGTGGGFRIFCHKHGLEAPDVVSASRKIQQSEKERCTRIGHNELVELVIGFDGIVLANSKSKVQINLTKQQLFEALSSHIKKEGTWIKNPNLYWSDISSELPNQKIKVLGPPPSSGTYESLNELVIKPYRSKTSPHLHIRSDGSYIEASSNENVIVQKLKNEPDAFGIFSYSLMTYNKDTLQSSRIDSISPSLETISDQSYTLSRPLYLYVKKKHLQIVPGLKSYLKTIYSDLMVGPSGFLASKGLVPLSTNDKQKQLQLIALNSE